MVMAGISAHAQARMQQRGINEAVLDRLLEYGKVAHDHHGAEVVFFNKPARRRLRRQVGPDASRTARDPSSAICPRCWRRGWNWPSTKNSSCRHGCARWPRQNRCAALPTGRSPPPGA